MRYSIQRNLVNADTTYVKLRWSHTYAAPAAVGAFQVQLIRANSAYDPDASGPSASQPVGYDQWAAMYRDYQVLGCAYDGELSGDQAAASPGVFCVYPSFTLSTSNLNSATSQPYAKSLVVSASGGSNKRIRRIKHFMRTKKLVGRSTSSVNYAATTTSDPSAVWYWVQVFGTMDGVTNAEYFLRVKITYYIKFWNRRALIDQI